jgi:hypothetical protein
MLNSPVAGSSHWYDKRTGFGGVETTVASPAFVTFAWVRSIERTGITSSTFTATRVLIA